MKTLRSTKSPCPKCLEMLAAKVIAKEDGIYLEKRCKQHGLFSMLISSSTRYYEELHNLYFELNRLNKKRHALKEYIFMYLTLRCNNSCPICYNRSNFDKYKEPSIEDIKKFLKKHKGKEIIPFGGEPTLRKDLPRILELIRKSGNIATIFTNGLVLDDEEYFRSLISAGLQQVRYSFLGFNDQHYKKIEGHGWLSKKLKTLDNLKRYDIPTTIECTICREVNMQEMQNILDFAVENRFIKAVMFRPYSFLGNKGLNKEQGTNPTHLIKELEMQTCNKVSEDDFIVFQKLLFMLSDSLNKKICLYQPYLILWRKKGDYVPITALLPRISLDRKTERYIKLRKKNKMLSSIYLFMGILLPMARLRNIRFIIDSLFVVLFSRFHLKSVNDSFLLLSFPVNCSPEVFDSELENNCTANEFMFGCQMANLAVSNLNREKKIKEEDSLKKSHEKRD